jgi:hypothetical protein
MTYVYDKAHYHDESVSKAGLPHEHSCNHTVPILRWLIENSLMSGEFLIEGKKAILQYKNGKLSIYELYEWWDNCLTSDMLSDEGNKFAMDYFDFERGKYIGDYKTTLQGKLPSEFHVKYSEDNYTKLRTVIDRRYARWKANRLKSWWQIWK